MRTCKECGAIYNENSEDKNSWCYVKQYSEDYSTKTKYWLCPIHHKEMVEKSKENNNE